MLNNREIDAVIVANGDFPSNEIPLQILFDSPLTICCDGGANEYIKRGYTPDIIIGDGDSISDQNRIHFADIIHYEADQQTNDQTKAVKYLLSQGKNRIAIIGATGKRDDHTIGNIALLAEYLTMGADIRSYTDYGVFIPCSGCSIFRCKPGAQVSIFNINAKGFYSEALAYPLYDFTALWQGTLNEAITDHFTISAQGEYIVYITYESKSK